MAFLDINPAYQSFLHQEGLTEPHRLLKLPALIISGHPDRNVARVTLGTGPSAVHAFVKREHRVPWKDRLANAWAGFGLVSRSGREFQVLRSLREAGVGCPEPIAAGEDEQGRAFLLVRELESAVDLRLFLRDRLAGRSAYQRHQFARQLGVTLASIHDAGFNHPDLYSKHVLVDDRGIIRFLDWQRSRRRRFLGWRSRWQDLAALDATVADDLATPGERLACLQAYLEASFPVAVPHSFLLEAVRQIRQQSRRLRGRRRIRELCQPPLATGFQNLIWLDGEALCVTREFQQEMEGQGLDWLSDAPETRGVRNGVRQSELALWGLRRVKLVRRCASRPLAWLWARLRRRPLTSPELEQAGVLFRLQRFGVETPRLLAVGQRHSLPWRTESFLLTEAPPGATRLVAWLARQSERPLWTAERKQRRWLIRQAGELVRHVHDAGYHPIRFREEHFLLQPAATPGQARVVLGALDGIGVQRHFRKGRGAQDLAALHCAFAATLGSRTDALRFLLSYLGARRLTSAAKSLARSVSVRTKRGAPEAGSTASGSGVRFSRDTRAA